MSHYKLHDENTAPEGARETLRQVKGSYGFIPNLMASMAESPSLVKAYAAISQLFQETSFSNTEQQVVLLAVSSENACNYCMAAHSTIAEMSNVPASAFEAIREGRPIPDEKLETLRKFVETVVRSRGWPTEEEIEDFFRVGYTHAHLLEVILGVGLKTLSNYTNHILETPLDDAFKPKQWEKVS